jgi:hypothetical protein
MSKNLLSPSTSRWPTERDCFVSSSFAHWIGPQDVRKVLSLELTGAYVNEAREIPKEVIDGLQGRVGRYPSKAQGGPSWFGILMDTNPWAWGTWGHQLFSIDCPEGFALFEQPSGLAANAENVENLPEGYYSRLTHGKDEAWVDEYINGLYPKADKGSIYGELVAKLEARGGICEFDHPNDGVFVNFDLGVSDATAMWWWRLGPSGNVDILDWYEASGEGASHYFEVLEGKTPKGCDRPRRYVINKIWLPHDARQRTFQTGVTTLDQFIKHFGADKVAIGPEVSIEAGIAAGRWLLEQAIRIHTRCMEGVRRLRAYRFAYDEERKVFSKKPLHDWTSHTADDWRYVSLVVHATEMLMRPPPEPERVTKPPAMTIEGIFESHYQQARRRRSF